MDLTDILLKIPVFNGLKREELKDLVSLLEEESFSANATVIREGVSGDSLYIIAKGSVNIYKSAKDRQNEGMLINSLKKNQYFGELALIDNLPRSASVITKEPSLILRLRKESLDKYLQERTHGQ